MAKKTIIQQHHITYDPAWVVPVTKGEHYVITRLQWLKEISPGARAAIEFELARKPVRKIDQ